MGLGWVGAYGARGGADALQQMKAELMKRVMLEQQMQQQQFENDRALSADALKRQQFEQGKTEFDATLGLNRDKLGFEQQQYTDAAPQRAANLRMTTAQAGRIEGEPAAQQAERDFALKMQGIKTADESKLIGQRVSGQLRVAGAQQAGTDPGWQIKEVTDPTTNQTKMMRVNSRTGEVQPVQLPDGMQPGGSRQTRLSAGQQDDLATMQTIEDMAGQVSALGNKIGWKGVGGMGTGSISQGLMKYTGIGSKDEEVLRNYIGNIQGTIAKLRGGTSFTPNEQAMLESYTPTINDSDAMIQAKIASLTSFIQTKRANTMKFAGADPMNQPAPSGGVVSMVAPDGRPLQVPAEKVAELEALGAKRR